MIITLDAKSSEPRIDSLTSNQKLKERETNDLINNILTPDYHNILSKYSFDKLGKNILSYEVTTHAGNKVTYQISELKRKENVTENTKSDSVVLKISNNPFYLEIERNSVSELLNLKREMLVENKEKAPGLKKQAITKMKQESNKY